jgi:Tol biopolymer transport system component
MRKLFLVFAAGVWTVSRLSAQEFCNVEYLCADWGPAMTLPAKPGEKPQFSETEEEIYFLQQVGCFTRRKLPTRDVLSGREYEDEGRGINIYLCKMKADGTGKTEIKELWRNVTYPIDTQGQSSWLDVNEKTRKIALAIAYAGSDLTGLWTMNLDGSDLKQIITPEWTDRYLQTINKPSWTPDGRWIVFEEELRGTNPNQHRIAKCDAEGKHLQRLTDGPKDQQPSVSPDGTTIVYVHDPRKNLGKNHFGQTMWVAKTLWLMDLDGRNKREIPNPEAKPEWPAQGISGSWPAWSPDGKRIYAAGAGVIDVTTGRRLLRKGPRLISEMGDVVEEHSTVVMSHWGRKGLVCSGWGVGITVVDEKFDLQRAVATSSLQEMKP